MPGSLAIILFTTLLARDWNKVTKMSAVKTILAITFAFFVTVTWFVPSFPPAQLLYEYVRIRQTTLSIWEIPVSTLLNAVTNGFFWIIIVATACGLGQLFLRLGMQSKPLSSMPVAPHLATPPPENPLVDSRVSRIPPALTVPPTAPYFAVRNEPVRVIMRTEPTPIKLSRKPMSAEIDIENVEGIGLVNGGLLRSLGIHTVSDLLRVGATELGRRRLANEVGVTSATVLMWVHRADLLRVRGIGRKYSALLESAGVNTTTDLSTKNPHYLRQRLKAVNRERNLVGRLPPSNTIEIWVRYAKNLEPILVE